VVGPQRRGAALDGPARGVSEASLGAAVTFALRAVLVGVAPSDPLSALGIRNAHDKSMRLAMTVGYRVLVCDNMAFSGDFTPPILVHFCRLLII
jgi:hypothetical protein